MMLDFLKRLALGLILAILTGIITYITAINQEKEEDQFHYLDSSVEISSTSVGGELSNKNIEVLFDGESISNFSEVEVSIFNYNNCDFESVPIYIEIIPQKGDSVRISKPEVLGFNGSENFVRVIQENIVPDSSGVILLKYMLDVVNRTDSAHKAAFTGDIFVVSDNPPTVRVSTGKSGLDLRSYDAWEHFYEMRAKWWEQDWAIILLLVIAYFLIAWPIIKIANYFIEKNNKKYRFYLQKQLAQSIQSGALILNSEKILIRIKEIREIYKEENGFFKKRSKTSELNPGDADDA